jgi:monoamine oxidase
MPTLYTALKARHTATSRKIALGGPTAYFAAMEVVEPGKVPSARHISLTDRFDIRPFKNTPPHVLVVGGGLAGLSAAYELKSVGYRVTVFEAQQDLGGRVKSYRNWIGNKVVEAGGELIGLNHAAWRSYAAKFQLPFLEASKGTPEDPIFLKGMLLTRRQRRELNKELDVAVRILNREANAISNPFTPWLAPNAKSLDELPLAKRLQRLPVSLLCILALDEQFEGDNGVGTDSQSYLGVLAMIRGGNGRDGQHSYWDDTETHRCKNGNVRLAEELSKGLEANELRRGEAVTEVAINENEVKVRVGDGEAARGDYVVVAVPPSVWSYITFKPGFWIQKRLHSSYRSPQMGKNVKFLMGFNSPFWAGHKGPGFSTDGPINLVWESTENQAGSGNEIALAAFSGGQDAEACEQWKDSERQAKYLHELGRAYQNANQAFVKGEFEDWPGAAWTKASYSFPRPGEVMKWGPFLEAGQGRLHFAGEHTCYAFVGYMEGALQSGLRIAEKLAKRDGILKNKTR